VPFVDLFTPVAACWCGDDADEGALPFVAGASGAWLDVASRWLGLEAALGAVELAGGAVCAPAREAELSASSPINVVRDFM
jgi:hypothetical protein